MRTVESTGHAARDTRQGALRRAIDHTRPAASNASRSMSPPASSPRFRSETPIAGMRAPQFRRVWSNWRGIPAIVRSRISGVTISPLVRRIAGGEEFRPSIRSSVSERNPAPNPIHGYLRSSRIDGHEFPAEYLSRQAWLRRPTKRPLDHHHCWREETPAPVAGAERPASSRLCKPICTLVPGTSETSRAIALPSSRRSMNDTFSSKIHLGVLRSTS